MIKKKRTNVFAKIGMHFAFCMAIVSFLYAIIGSFVSVETLKGNKLYRIKSEDEKTAYEESVLYNTFLGNSISDLVYYGILKSQLETDGSFDPDKEVDITAFANRFGSLSEQYITADYTINDLIKWAKSGFEYESVVMTDEELKKFLSEQDQVRSVSDEVILSNYNGYLNADLGEVSELKGVSANDLNNSSGGDHYSVKVLHSKYHSSIGLDPQDYVSSLSHYEGLCANLESTANDLLINYQDYQKYNEYYANDNTNIVYAIITTKGKTRSVYSNISNLDLKANNQDIARMVLESSSKYVIYDKDSHKYETNTQLSIHNMENIFDKYQYAYPEKTIVVIGVLNGLPFNDNFSVGKHVYEQADETKTAMGIAVIFSVIYLLLFIFLIRKEKESKIEDRIYTEVWLLLHLLFVYGCVALFVASYGSFGDQIIQEYLLNNKNFILMISVPISLLLSFLIGCLILSDVRRIKNKVLWKNSFIYAFMKWCKKWIHYFADNGSLILKTWVPYVLLCLLQFVFAGVVFSIKRTLIRIILIFVLLSIDTAFGLYYYSVNQKRGFILAAINRICNGEVNHKVDLSTMHGDNLVLAKAVNRIGESVKESVEISMKDERLKADLITNVSHDIKTPLTSIINYVDLMKREEIDNQKVKEYIHILDMKSQRLKQLTDDLVEASKISSGNIVLHMEKLNFKELIKQAIGEFSEKFDERNLEPVLNIPNENIYVLSDSRRIWRVLENLLNNVCKYALKGTRIYIDLISSENENGKMAVLSIKNISANALNVSPEMLTERFVRGDESRTTEGSGLGLSIARNLTEALNGELSITIDGDLFKATLEFEQMNEV